MKRFGTVAIPLLIILFIVALLSIHGSPSGGRGPSPENVLTGPSHSIKFRWETIWSHNYDYEVAGLAVLKDKRLAISGAFDSLQISSLSTNQKNFIVDAKGWVPSKPILFDEMFFFPNVRDGEITIWNLETPKLVKTISLSEVKDGVSEPIALAVAPDGTWLAGAFNQGVEVVTLPTFHTLVTNKIDIPDSRIVISPDSRQMAFVSASGAITFFDFWDHKFISVPFNVKGKVTYLFYLNATDLALVADTGKVYTMRSSDRQANFVTDIPVYNGYVSDACVSSTRNIVILRGMSNEDDSGKDILSVWSHDLKKMLYRCDGQCFALSNDGKWMVIVCNDNQLQVRDALSGQLEWECKSKLDSIQSLAWFGDSTQFADGGYMKNKQGMVEVWKEVLK